METIAWIGFSQALFAAVLLMAKKGRTIPDKILTAWLFLLAIEFLSCAIDYRFYGYALLSSSFLLFNPAFYLYVCSLVQPKFRLSVLHLLHLIPFLFFEVFAYVLHEPYVLFGYFNNDTTYWFRFFFALASLVSWIVYNSIASILIFRHRLQLVDEFSSIESNKRITWLIFVVIFYNVFCLLLITSGIFNLFFNVEFPLLPVVNYSALLLLVYILGFYGLKQEVIYSKVTKYDSQNATRSYSPLLSKEQSDKLRTILFSFFEKDKPYLNPELSMDMLANALGFPKHHITEVLNKEIGKNFFQFVNEYRVNAVKEMLIQPKNFYSIEAIGFECGFNSKSSFFTIFKKATGQTPLQYKNSNC